jgi:SNF2 family DNA or RNA helicase
MNSATRSPPTPSATTLILKPFQAEDVATLRQHNYRALVANAPGTGKTIVALTCITRERERLMPAVIVCPASVVTNWCREAKKWVPNITILAVTEVSSRLPQNAPNVLVISWSLLVERVHEILAYRPRFLVVDEAHFAKGEDTQRTHALRVMARRTPHMILLSGTPLINNVKELENIKDIFSQPEVPMIRRLLEDVVPEVPPKTRCPLPVSLRPKDMQAYRKAEGEFSEWLETELRKRMSHGDAAATAQRALAAEALVKSGYLRRLLAVGKVYAASDWIARAVRLGEPVVVFCEHQEVVMRLQDALRKQRIGFVTIDGGTSRKDRQRAIDYFQAGRVPVFIGTKAAKEGITLHRAKHMLFVERYWTSAEEEQAEDRIRRIGQTRPTNIWFLHATGTVDDRIQQIIDRKRRLVAQTIGAADIAEKDEDDVISLIAAWEEKTSSAFEGQETDLGLGKPLPPIPPAVETVNLVFKGTRWTNGAVRAWAMLHGFKTGNIVTVAGGLKVDTNSPSIFEPGRFKTVTISSEIKAVVGVRKGSHSTRPSRKSSIRPKGR